ncbi:MAG: radical SAM family heme chaperone HemW [Methyloligellaceae bacterium]
MSHQSNNGDPGFAVYVHWPFCQSKCPYCDFNSHVRQNGIDEDRFLQAYLHELDYTAQSSPDKNVKSIFFGGGTPSLMKPQTVEAIINHIAKIWKLEAGAEITLEANPTSVEASRFKAYNQIGVNRVSVGVQALNDQDLKKLGRLHSAEEALKAIEIAAETFSRYSFDLIYARPGQSPEDWQKELETALQWAVGHLSLYQLTIEPGTRFADLYAAGKLKIPNSELAEEHYLITQQVCEANNLPAYEISNHAREGEQCEHNLIYWNYGEYAGIGPGAHGRLNIDGQTVATSCIRNPEIWRNSVEENNHGHDAGETLSREQQADEMVIMGLRLKTGINLTRLKEMTGYQVSLKQLSQHISDGLLSIDSDNNYLSATPKGWFILNHLISEIAQTLSSEN